MRIFLCQGLALATPGLRSPIRDIRGRNSAVPITPHTPGMALNFPLTPHTPASAYGRHFPQTPGGKSTRVGIGILMYARAHCLYYTTDTVLRTLLLSTILRCTECMCILVCKPVSYTHLTLPTILRV